MRKESGIGAFYPRVERTVLAKAPPLARARHGHARARGSRPHQGGAIERVTSVRGSLGGVEGLEALYGPSLGLESGLPVRYPLQESDNRDEDSRRGGLRCRILCLGLQASGLGCGLLEFLRNLLTDFDGYHAGEEPRYRPRYGSPGASGRTRPGSPP